MVYPIDFINQLRESEDYIEAIYSNGGCYQFYKILKLLYPNAIAYKVKVVEDDKNHSHVITLIENVFYDIKGKVNINNYYDIKKVEDRDIAEMEKWSFSKRHWLYKECLSCGELISY